MFWIRTDQRGKLIFSRPITDNDIELAGFIQRAQIHQLFSYVSIEWNYDSFNIQMTLIDGAVLVNSDLSFFNTLGVQISEDDLLDDQSIRFSRISRPRIEAFLRSLEITQHRITDGLNTLTASVSSQGRPRSSRTFPTQRRPLLERQDGRRLRFTSDESEPHRQNENSMDSLTRVQQDLFTKIQAKYATELEHQGGVGEVMNKLSEHLKQLYLKSQIKYTLNDKDIDLPLKWDELHEILKDLPEEQQQDILKLYYQNTVHTAYRYFLKPNPWITPDSIWAEGVPNKPRWANFEKYTKEIAFFWLAASDQNEAGAGKLSVVDRQLFFIGHLALINRGHNLDSDLDRALSSSLSGAVSHTAVVSDVEKDDLRGDNPACHMGVLSRVYSGLVDHSLLTVAPGEIIKIQLSAFYQEYYKNILQSLNQKSLVDCIEQINNGKLVTALNNAPSADLINNYLSRTMIDLQRTLDRDLINAVFNGIHTELTEYKIIQPTDDVATQHFYKNFNLYGLNNILSKEIERRKTVTDEQAPRPRSPDI